MLAMTNMKCTLENYVIEEDADNGFDSYASVTLKQWKPWGAKRIEVKTDKDGTAKVALSRIGLQTARWPHQLPKSPKGRLYSKSLRSN